MRFVKLFSKFLLMMPLLSVICVACSKEESYIDEPKSPTTPIVTPEEKVEYYVKYESSVTIPTSSYVTIGVTVLTEKGIQQLSVPRSWEGIFGPFNELKTLSISAASSGFNENMTSCRGRISICRGNQPFILKAEKSSKGTAYNVSYTVTKDDLK